MFPLSAFWSSPAMAMTLAILDVVLASIVTIDVLLKKSDVRGALGWIGAVWFAPILGSLLYYLFGINRVMRRALKLNRLHEKQATPPEAVTPKAATHIALLSQVSARVTQNPLTGGNAFTVLEGGDKAYPEMLAAIRSAKHCIAMSSYIFRNDAAGQEFAQALIEAVKRGVAVRVLLDSIGAG
jgi:cardiolipin synthase A/B